MSVEMMTVHTQSLSKRSLSDHRINPDRGQHFWRSGARSCTGSSEKLHHRGCAFAGEVAIFLWCASILCPPAHGQRADDNVVKAAEDAFGITLGDESIGLYSNRDVRGFSPETAGNIRLEGLYFDARAVPPTHLVEGSAIRVGLTAQGYPFPAPTGIVDYQLHKADDATVLSIATGLDLYASPLLQVDAKIPLATDEWALATGLSYAMEEYGDGADAHYLRAALVPRWQPSEQVEIIPFWAFEQGRDEEATPTIVTSGAHVPPQIRRRKYFGPHWADLERDNLTYGALAKMRVRSDWAIVGGVFRSDSRMSQSFADLYLDTQPDGLTNHVVIADPEQRYQSTSGEVRVSKSFATDPRVHVLHFSLRGRHLDSRYGGSASPLDFGWRLLGDAAALPKPENPDFGERTHDEVQQWTAGLMYEARWRDVGYATIGLQRARYEKRMDQPDSPAITGRDDPWLPVATLAMHLSRAVVLYAGFTRGLEESGTAPENAVNRNEVLPAVRTRQFDAGMRWTIRSGLSLVAGAFDVQKPYLTTNPGNVFTTLGNVRHRGLELSLSGDVHPHWSLVTGALLMQPRVTGEAVDLGLLGNRPVGPSERVLRLDVEYRPPSLQSWSFDASVVNYGDRVASSDNRLVLPAYTLIDLGARYRTAIGRAPVTLRFQAVNLTDEFAWFVSDSNSFGHNDGRGYSALLFIDF